MRGTLNSTSHSPLSAWAKDLAALVSIMAFVASTATWLSLVQSLAS